MKNIVTLVFLLTGIGINAQAYEGKGDMKFQVGANLQSDGSGINTTFDYGVGENISLGVSATYLLGVNSDLDPDFGDRFDIRGRFNANIGQVMQLGDQVDVYPGLSLGLRNFGGHLGVRYFFSDGFGLYSEIGFPIAKYQTDDLTPVEELNNQFAFVIGASFNIK